MRRAQDFGQHRQLPQWQTIAMEDLRDLFVDNIEKYDCFVSHSSKDVTNAMSLVERLESRGVKCWVAPRNIRAGAAYASEIVVGIQSSVSFIVLISKESLTSRHVEREVNIADGLRKSIYPVKLADIKIYGGLSFYLSVSQEIRLFEKESGPVEKLISSIRGGAVSVDTNNQKYASVDSAITGLPTEPIHASEEHCRDSNELYVKPFELNIDSVRLERDIDSVHLDPDIDSVRLEPDEGSARSQHDNQTARAVSTAPRIKLLLTVSLCLMVLYSWLYFFATDKVEDESADNTLTKTSNSPTTYQTLPSEGRLPVSEQKPEEQIAESLPAKDTTREETALTKDVKLPDMWLIAGGAFDMGSENVNNDEQPLRQVTVASFEIARHELTWGEWSQCEDVGVCRVLQRPHWINELGTAGAARHPVVNVNWDDTQTYIGWINTLTDGGYRLPSESEYEYVLRAGSEGRFPWPHSEQCDYTNGADKSFNLSTIDGWGTGCDDGYANTAPVASFPANLFGIYDISGNVWEWVKDCWNQNYIGAPSDGSTWEAGECDQRVLRGGSWTTALGSLRSANRYWGDRDFVDTDAGFRLAKTVTPLENNSTNNELSDLHVIGPGDILEISVWGYEDLSITLPVEADGKINTRFAEDFAASGKTPTQLARDLETVYKIYIRNPAITITVIDFGVEKVVLSARVLYPYGDYRLSSQGEDEFESLIEKLHTYNSIELIDVVGHNDSIGSKIESQKIALKRAVLIASTLRKQFPNIRIDYSSLGETTPIADNDTFEGRRLNRRVEIRVEATQLKY